MAEIKVERKIMSLASAMQEAIHKLNEVGDSFEVIGSALDMMMDAGCGQPGHTTCTSDEGTRYCLTCELQGQNKRLRAEQARLIKALNKVSDELREDDDWALRELKQFVDSEINQAEKGEKNE